MKYFNHITWQKFFDHFVNLFTLTKFPWKWSNGREIETSWENWHIILYIIHEQWTMVCGLICWARQWVITTTFYFTAEEVKVISMILMRSFCNTRKDSHKEKTEVVCDDGWMLAFINKFGWDVNIKSIQEGKFSRQWVGSLITCLRPYWVGNSFIINIIDAPAWRSTIKITDCKCNFK